MGDSTNSVTLLTLEHEFSSYRIPLFDCVDYITHCTGFTQRLYYTDAILTCHVILSCGHMSISDISG